jgi:branched-chain amino acid transport system ATP-binding protein
MRWKHLRPSGDCEMPSWTMSCGAMRAMSRPRKRMVPTRAGVRPEIVRLGICQSPEGRRCFQRMTLRENLELGAFLRRDSAGIREDLDRVFDLFPRLKEREVQKAGTMSGGEQQMLAIGRALMGQPKLLLLDEPSMGIAPILVERIYETIAEINKQGMTILLVEQNANFALDVSKRGYVLETGKVVMTDESASLRTNPEVQKAYLGT